MDANAMIELYNSLLLKVASLENEVKDLKEAVRSLKRQGDDAGEKEYPRFKNKYVALAKRLYESNQESLVFTIEELNAILAGDGVSISPNVWESEKNIRLGFSNTWSHSLAASWLSAGYKVKQIKICEGELEQTRITFEKN